MRNSRQRPASIVAQRATVAFVMLSLFAVACPNAHAAAKTWTNQTSSGTYQTGGNWNPAATPASGDDLTFTNNFAYTVNWSGSATAKSASFSSGVVTQNIGAANTWTLTSGYSIGDTANKTAQVVQTSGTLAVATTVTLSIGD